MYIKSKFSKKATMIWRNLPVGWILNSKSQTNWEISSNISDLLRKHELYKSNDNLNLQV